MLSWVAFESRHKTDTHITRKHNRYMDYVKLDRSSWFAGGRWPMFNAYVLDEDRQEIRASGKPTEWRYLSEDQQLLADLAAVDNGTELLGWCEHWGLPCLHVDVAPSELDWQSMSTPVDYVLREAAHMRRLLLLLDLIRAQNVVELRNMARMWDARKARPDQPGWAAAMVTRVMSGDVSPQCLAVAFADDPDIYLTTTCEEARKPDGVLNGAAVYLAMAVNRKLEPLRVQTGPIDVDGKIEFVSAISITTPLQSAWLTLHNGMVGNSGIKLCPHPRCRKPYPATRKNRACCGSEKCQRWVTRSKQGGL